MGPCEWPVDYTECGNCFPDPSSSTPAEEGSGDPGEGDTDEKSPDQVKFEQAASELLWNFTHRKFGVCSVTVRPCAPIIPSRASDFDLNGRLQPTVINGVVYQMTCGCAQSTSACSCTLDGLRSVRLPGPVVEIEEVWLDGEILDPSEYRLDYGNVLIRSYGSWPRTQDLMEPTSEPNTFSITYRRGLAVPVQGQMAAGMLACELYKAYCKDNTCQLPQRLQTITRQGVTVGFMDQFEGLSDGMTGIWSIDSWIMSVTRPTPSASIKSPDYRGLNSGYRY